MDQIITLQVISASCLRHDPGETLRLASQALERAPVESRLSSLIARCEVLYKLIATTPRHTSSSLNGTWTPLRQLSKRQQI